MSSVFVARKINQPSKGSQDDHESAAIPVDVFRSAGKLVIVAPIAGITIEDISVTITDDILTIKGRRDQPEEENHAEYFSSECFWGHFDRTIVLPVNVDTNKVSAFYKKGILRIEMPILDEIQTRVIPVKLQKD